jgi:ParB family chromosome partitioning protein
MFVDFTQCGPGQPAKILILNNPIVLFRKPHQELPMTAKTAQLIPLTQIDPNPWNTRPLDDAHVRALAEDIAAHGLLQTPQARPHPDQAGRYQLAFGHHRHAAYAWLAKKGYSHPVGAGRDGRWEKLPVEVRSLPDMEMLDIAIAENEKHKPLSPIEKAQTLKRLTEPPFALSQAEAGKRFGLTQSGVSNLLRLLQLPEPLQRQVGEGGLPERFARQLVSLSRSLPAQAAAIAEKVIEADAAVKESTFDDAADSALRKHGRAMFQMPFTQKWSAPIPAALESDAQALGLTALPPCASCEFFIERDHQSYCARPACYDLKARAFVLAEVARLSKALKIAAAGPGEKTVLVFDGDSRAERLAASALLTKHESLRLAGHVGGDYNGYARKRVMASEHVCLHTTDLAALKKAIAKLPQAKKQSAADRIQSDYKRDEKQRATRRAERIRLMRAAAPHVAKAFAWPEPMLDLVLPALTTNNYILTHTQVEERAKKATLAAKQQLVAEIVISDLTDAVYQYTTTTPDAARKRIVELAARLKVKLPREWDAPPDTAPAVSVRARGRPLPANGHKAAKPAPKAHARIRPRLVRERRRASTGVRGHAKAKAKAKGKSK